MVLTVILLAVSAILAAIAAFWAPPAPPRANLVALALCFLSLAFLVQYWPGG